MSDISARRTRRGASLLSIPIHRTALYNKSFTVSACRLWNALPDNIRSIDKRDRFGAEVRAFLLRTRRDLSTFKPIAAQSSQYALALHRVKVSVWFYFKVIWATTVARAIVCVMSNPKCARLTKRDILDEFDNPLSSDEEDCVAVDSDDGEVDHVEEEIRLPHEEDEKWRLLPLPCDNEDNTPLGNVFYSKDKHKRVMKWTKCPLDPSNIRTRASNIVLRLPGPRGEARNTKTEIDCFNLYFDDDVIEMIVNGTNIYILGIKDQFERERDARPIYKTEIRAFIGILLLSGCLGS
ncbi:hypothetical protein J6590_065552 [Homalodisca vitripennis]|nr:hypothetical protein J6590_065552 [Homalodisca vitripennis]